jgi:hypothetical protein
VSAAAAAAEPQGEWERRSTISLERVFEQVLLYNELGFEVRLEPVTAPEAPGACDACFHPDSGERVLWVRRAR